VKEIKTVPYVPLSHPWADRLYTRDVVAGRTRDRRAGHEKKEQQAKRKAGVRSNVAFCRFLRIIGMHLRYRARDDSGRVADWRDSVEFRTASFAIARILRGNRHVGDSLEDSHPAGLRRREGACREDVHQGITGTGNGEDYLSVAHQREVSAIQIA
jgi:hypothetical protein